MIATRAARKSITRTIVIFGIFRARRFSARLFADCRFISAISTVRSAA
jgi:hypothetical protein